MQRSSALKFVLSALWFFTSLGFAQTLTVKNGSLGLKAIPGVRNDIWADAPAADLIFDHWDGAAAFTDPTAWHTTVVMPSAGTTVTAIYKVAPAWTPVTYVLNGLAPTALTAVSLIYHIPPHPIGMIFFFHGAGGAAANIMDNVESLALAREAVAAGYGFAALDSNNRITRWWDSDATSANVDVANVQTSINHLINLGLITAATPKFAAGMSDGGGFAPKPANYLGFQGCGMWCSQGNPSSFFTSSTIPAFWNLAWNDDQKDHTAFMDGATNNQENLVNRGVPGELRENAPSPVYPHRFARIESLSTSDSQRIFDNLKKNGFLDAQNYLLQDPTTSGVGNVIPVDLLGKTGPIISQLECCYSGHNFFSDFNSRAIGFFNAHNPLVHPAFFGGEVPLSGGFYYLQLSGGQPFGYYSYQTYPYVYHVDLGFEYCFDANDGFGGIYFYDFTSGHFFYTSKSYPFPYFYDFSLNAIVYYYADSLHPGYFTTAPRYFYNCSTGQIFTM